MRHLLAAALAESLQAGARAAPAAAALRFQMGLKAHTDITTEYHRQAAKI